MSENVRGQNTERNRPESENEVNQGSGRPDLAQTNLGSERQVSLNRGTTDMDPQPSIGTNVRPSGSGITTKRNVTGSDYDGQLSSD
ncbi:hypothetical protein V9K67_12190 [Paraflavisolibacter sp. H34]|uniref:hypothetical protein n=1 Tax=Huijunlia imazamoxiresistens TaxID=3127457 RepID=UPI003015A6B3